MRCFIKDTRVYRKQEIIEYEKKGYVIENKNYYLLVDRIIVNYYGKDIPIGIRVSDQELYFIFINQGANILFSISDLYKMMQSYMILGHPVIHDLKKQLLNTSDKTIFCYKGIQYEMIKPVQVDDQYYVLLPNSHIEIPYCYLLTIIALIQSKSNCLFGNSSDYNKKFIDGLYRLLICLLVCSGDNQYLLKRGWIWNSRTQEYELRKERVAEEFKNYKYYLTQKEMESIID